MNPTRERWLLGTLVLLGLSGSLLLALSGASPTELPGVALGSHALLSVEKATTAFTAYLLVLVVVVRAFACASGFPSWSVLCGIQMPSSVRSEMAEAADSDHELVSAAYLEGYRARVEEERRVAKDERSRLLDQIRVSHLRAQAIEGTDADPLVQAKKHLDRAREIENLRRRRRRSLWL